MAALSWRFTYPETFRIGSNTTHAQDYLAAINTIVSNNSGAADAIWEVVSYVSTSPRSLLLRRKDLSPGRILLFGEVGSTPNAAAVQSGATSSHLVIAYSPTSTENVVAGSWISGAPLATDYIPGCTLSRNNNAVQQWRMYYAENTAGIFFFGQRKTVEVTPVTEGWYGGAGDHFVGIDGSYLPGLFTSGNSVATGWSSTSTGFLAPSDSGIGYNGASEANFVRYGGRVERVYRVVTLSSVGGSTPNQQVLLNDSESRMYFLPVVMSWQVNYARRGIAGKMRQIAIGPQALMDTFLHDASTDVVTAHGFCPTIAALGDTMWFINNEV